MIRDGPEDDRPGRDVVYDEDHVPSPSSRSTMTLFFQSSVPVDSPGIRTLESYDSQGTHTLESTPPVGPVEPFDYRVRSFLCGTSE